MDIRIEGLSKTYGTQRAVDDISFEVRPGEVLGFLGPNGAGKTTTMKMILGLIAPDAGRIAVGGHDVLAEPGAVRKRVGYLPESNPQYEDMPVLDFLRFVARIQGVPEERITDRLAEMVRACGLDAEKHKRIGELSKGYRQRVGLAQAMVHDPEVLILDEPTTGLDPNQIVEIRALIKELGRAKTVIFSTHILPEVEAVCDRILIIDRGRIVADGDPATLRRQAQGREVLRARIEGAIPETVLSALAALPGVEQAVVAGEEVYDITCAGAGREVARSLFGLCAHWGWPITELRPLETRLEDIFRHLTLN